jgi:hypothetical protein
MTVAVHVDVPFVSTEAGLQFTVTPDIVPEKPHAASHEETDPYCAPDATAEHALLTQS